MARKTAKAKRFSSIAAYSQDRARREDAGRAEAERREPAPEAPAPTVPKPDRDYHFDDRQP